MTAFQNEDIVNAYEYYDDKNRERVQGVKEKLSDSKKKLGNSIDVLNLMKLKLERSETQFEQKHGQIEEKPEEETPTKQVLKLNLSGLKAEPPSVLNRGPQNF